MNLMNQIQYLNDFLDEDMFDDCSVPSGLTMERVRGAITMRCGLLTPLYSEPETQRAATQQFFFENQWNFQHIVNVLTAEYSPIENVAEWRDESGSGKGTETLNISRTGTEQHSGTDERETSDSGTITDAQSGTTREAEGGTTAVAESGTTKDAESGTTAVAESGTTKDAESGTTAVATQYGKISTREISAENATAYQADNRETLSGTDTETTTHGKTDTTTHGKTETTTHGKTDTVTHGKTETTTHGKTDTVTHGRTDTETRNLNGTDNLTHGEKIDNESTDSHEKVNENGNTFSMHRHGNVGVTTNQQMINQELDLLERFNPYRFIADLYEKELILGLY